MKATERDLLPLLPMQRLLWSVSAGDPQSPLYRLPLAFRIHGELDVSALEYSLTTVIDRHAALRAKIDATPNGPVQRIRVTVPFRMAIQDLAGIGDGAEGHVSESIEELLTARFDPFTHAGVCAELFRLAPADHVLVILLNAALVDTRSIPVLLAEIAAYHDAFVTGTELAPAAPPLSYAEAAVRAWPGHAEAIQRRVQRTERLIGLPPAELPYDRSRPTQASYEMGTVTVRMAPVEAGALRALTDDGPADMAVLAALCAVLARWSGRRELAVAIPTVECSGAEVPVGQFENLVPVRCRVHAGLTFRELLAGLREECRSAGANGDVPFEQIVRGIMPRTGPCPVAPVLFRGSDDNAATVPAFQDLRCTPYGHRTPASPFALELRSRSDTDGGLHLDLRYARDLFERRTAEGLGEDLATLLRAAPSAHRATLGDLPPLEQPDGGRESVLEGIDEVRCVQDIVELRARDDPGSVALIDADTALDFAELQSRAEDVCRELRRRGVRAGNVVAILLERTVQIGPAVLGVLRAGGCYLALDPALPPDRMRYVLADSKAVIVVCDRAGAGRVAGHDRLVIDDEIDGPLAEELGERAPRDPLGSAYAVYTSGSTGTPKGIVLSHRVLLNLLHWHLRELGVPRGPVLQYAPLSFDASIHELLVAWAAGVPAVITTEAERHDPARLGRRIADTGVRRVILPGLVLEMLARELGAGPTPLHDVITTGERLQITPTVRAFFESHPLVRLHNHYGPSETHVVTAVTLSSDPAGWPTFPSIGTPITGVRILLSSETLGPVPAGTPGELAIGGVALADGYLGDPRRTAERFVPDPSGCGARPYRTGDIARVTRYGRIEFIGRADRQVKVRGFRVELGDVEAALLRHPGVAAVAVIVTGEAANARLTAFVVPAGNPLAPEEVRTMALAALPYYMVPAGIVMVRELPRTRNGKVDAAALAAMAGERPAHSAGTAWTPAMAAASAIWTAVLPDLGRAIRPADNFFDLGGHSLLATRIVAEAERVWDKKVPIRLVFETATLSEFAEALGDPSEPHGVS